MSKEMNEKQEEAANQSLALKQVLRNLGKAVLGINVLFVIILLFFLGSAWSPKDQYSRIHIAVADYDGGLVGAALMAAFTASKANGKIPAFTYHVQNTTTRGPEELRNAIDKGDYHAGWVIPPLASSRLAAALADGSDSPLPLFELQYDEGRGGVGISNLVKTTGYNFFYRFQHELGTRLAESVERRDAGVQNASPALLARPATIFEDRIHKVPYLGAANMSGFVWSVLYAITFGISMIIHAAYAPMIKAGVRKDQVVIAQICHLLFVTLFVSIWPISVIGMLGMKYSGATYFQMWSFMWFCQFLFATLGYFWVALLGPLYGFFVNALFYILNLISSTSTYPMEFMNPFFQIGEGLLIYQGSNGTRTILFGSYDRLHRNIGVLFGWFGLLMSYIIYRWTKFHYEYRATLAKLAESRDDVEKAEKSDNADPETPKPNVLGFFDPKLEEPRKKLKKLVLATSAIFSIVCLIFVLEFLGAAWNPNLQYHRFKIAVADYDGSLVGTSLTDAIAQDRHLLPDFGFEIIDTTKVSVSELRKKVDNGDYNVAFWVPEGSTALLTLLLTDGTPDNLQTSASLKFTFDEGRGGSLVATTLRRAANQLTDLVVGRVAREAYDSIETGRLFLGTTDVSEAPPDVVAVPVELSEDNLHPVSNPGANNLAGLVWILLLGVSMPLGSMAIGVLMPLQTVLKMSIYRVKAYRILMIAFVALTLTFWPPVIVRGLGFHMSGKTFFQCWAFLWFTMSTFGILMLNTTSAFGHASGLVNIVFLITQLISSTAVYPMEYMQPFFQIGYAFHMTQGVQAMRTILFGSYDRLGRCVGVLFGWLVVALVWSAYLAVKQHKKASATVAAAASDGASPSPAVKSSYTSEKEETDAPGAPADNNHARKQATILGVSAAASVAAFVTASGAPTSGGKSRPAANENGEALKERDPSAEVPWVETMIVE